MAATELVRQGFSVHLYEKRSGLGRKLLIAGSSGLNISHAGDRDEFLSYYVGLNQKFWKQCFNHYFAPEWIHWIETLGLETFLGTSDRYFVKEMKASTLLSRWVEWLKAQGVQFFTQSEQLDFEIKKRYAAVGFFCGGGSWEKETPRWVGAFRQQGIQVVDFYPTNVGYEIEWKKELLQESEGHPLKNITLTTSKGSKQGECVITHYGLEGTPVYFVGKEGKATLDLKPQFTEEQILKKLMSVKENFSPLRRIKKTLGLSETALSLIFHQSSIRLISPDQSNQSNEKALREVAKLIKQFPLEFKKPRPLLEAISCGGGVSADEVDEFLMLKKYPGIYCGGEMLDWTAPTGGYWIQGCVSQGAWVAKSIINYMK
jgi:uncharacterized flavoprotein (TIGR03862 family)